MVVSTYCRRCRLHVEIDDGKVKAAGAPSEPALGPPADQRPEPPPPPPAPPPIRTRKPDDELPIPTPQRKRPQAKRKRPLPLKRLRQFLLPKPKRRYVLCDSCWSESEAPLGANATNCPSCGAYLALHDFDILEPFHEAITTRGNVTIHRRGKISGTTIRCHDLIVRGRLEADAVCTGTLVIRRSGLVRGKIRCARLNIPGRSKVEFIHPVDTAIAVVNGDVTGSIRATRTVTLLKRSRLRGNVTATKLVLKQGACHTGALREIAE